MKIVTENDRARLLAIRPRAERADRALLDRLVMQLRGRVWVRRRDLCAELSLPDDRVRELARYSDGEIVGSSAHGYGLTAEIPVEQVNRVIAELLSRSRELRARAVEITKAMHRRTDRMDGAA